MSDGTDLIHGRYSDAMMASALARTADAVEPAPPRPPVPYLRVVRQAGLPVLDGTAAFELPATGPDIGWARWRWDGSAVTVETCRYGLRPLYYHATPTLFLIAPSIATLLALGAPTELDPPAIAVYLRFENFLGEDTPFRHIRALPPAARLHWDGALRVTGTLHRPESETLPRAVAAEEYGRRFRAAIERAVSA
ncbi:MAG: hypothetical protein JO021_08770, partial [Alphaproteobacteria bacterium]|nr:hypothetical protein [Alphaproteobacteria bacterium]